MHTNRTVHRNALPISGMLAGVALTAMTDADGEKIDDTSLGSPAERRSKFVIDDTQKIIRRIRIRQPAPLQDHRTRQPIYRPDHGGVALN